MPNTFIDNRDAWLRMSDIDYLGQFVKAWLSFNAWYRSAYAEASDRRIINEIKWSLGGSLGNKIRPLLVGVSDESAQLRADIGLLHHRLENYEINEGKDLDKRRITLTQIYLKDNSPGKKAGTHWGYEFSVDRQSSGQVITEVKRTRDSWIPLNHVQLRYDLDNLEAQPAFQNDVPSSVQPRLRQVYIESAPRHFANLLEGTETPIACGAFSFRCGRDAIFAGVVEAIYLMRCTLFHGELAPTRDAIASYEPAYRLVRRFLDCIT
jgi:hypothetical protein